MIPRGLVLRIMLIVKVRSRIHPPASNPLNLARRPDAYRAWASAEQSPRLKSYKPLRSHDSTPSTNPAVDVSQVAKLLVGDTLEVMTSSGSRRLPALISPRNRAGKRIRYVIYEYDELIDSSDVGLNHWSSIALDIKRNYAKFDAFVVLHGTDVRLGLLYCVELEADWPRGSRLWLTQLRLWPSCSRIWARASS